LKQADACLSGASNVSAKLALSSVFCTDDQRASRDVQKSRGKCQNGSEESDKDRSNSDYVLVKFMDVTFNFDETSAQRRLECGIIVFVGSRGV